MQKFSLLKGVLNPGLLHDSQVPFQLDQGGFVVWKDEESGILNYNRLGVEKTGKTEKNKVLKKFVMIF